jgi:hypothetical protein
MEELLELRRSLEIGQYDQALTIVNEMTAMARKDIVQKIGSFVCTVLVHLIKHHAEGRMTRSWANSLRFAVEEIRETNERPHSSGVYVEAEELQAIIERKFPLALAKAAEEAFEGRYSVRELLGRIDAERMKAQALGYILNGMPESED